MSRAPGSRRHRRARHSTTRRIVVWAVAAAAAVLVVLGAAAALRLVAVADDLQEARDLLTAAGDQVEAGDLAGAQDGIVRAERLLVAADERLRNSPELDVVGNLPVIDQNLSALRDTVGVALELTAGGERILGVAEPLQDPGGRLEVPLRGGGLPLGVLVEARREIGALLATLPVTAEEGSSLLVGPVRDAHRAVFAEAVERREQLDVLDRSLTLLNEIAGVDGPRRHLIAVANTAEMRGTGGMILSYGVLESDAGAFTLAAFGNIDELLLAQPVDPALGLLSTDEAARWDGLDPTRLWRNANLVPDMAVVGARLDAMYEAATGLPLDGVIQIDAGGLAAILRGIGPVEVPGFGRVGAGNVVDRVLNRAYVNNPRRNQRQELLADVAAATFDRLVAGDYPSLRRLAEALAEAAAARHVVLWSERPAAADVARSFEADGALPAADAVDYTLLTVQNFSRNKLDYYLDSTLELSGTRPVGEPGALRATVTLANTVPGDVPSEYVLGGPQTGSGLEPGVYRGTASLYLPTGTTLVGASGAAAPPALLTEQGRTVVAFAVDLAPGAVAVVELDLRLDPRPAGDYELALVPVPRVRPTTVRVDIDTGAGVARHDGPVLAPTVATAVPPEVVE